jgi:hypothetical protein
VKVSLERDPDREAIRAADLRELVQANRQAMDAVAASQLPATAKVAFAEVFRELRILARLIGVLARAQGIAPRDVPVNLT